MKRRRRHFEYIGKSWIGGHVERKTQKSFQQGNYYLFVIIKSNEQTGRFLITGRHMKKQNMKNHLCNIVATFISLASRFNLLQCY